MKARNPKKCVLMSGALLMIKLTREQKENLWCAYENARNVDDGLSQRRGEHAILVNLLIKLGFAATSIVGAYKICERIFGW